MNDAEHFKKKSDFELEYTLRTHIPEPYEYAPALKEILRRKSEKEQQDRNTQKVIKIMTAVILVLTIASLIVGVVALSR
jgi:uncharacterized membrane-anchored protein